LLYGHGGSYNHGAEAALKSTIRIIREKYDGAFIAVSSHFPEQDIEFGLDADEFFAPDPEAWHAEKLAVSISDKERLARDMYARAIDSITHDTVCISVGGDNFSYPNWHRLVVFQQAASRLKAKTILWGCSIQPSAITREMTEVLRTYSHIIARESITYKTLQSAGLSTEVHLVPDPAFMLAPEPVQMPCGFQERDIVGINISPLIMRREPVSGMIAENIQALIDHILIESDFNIILIPHVTTPADNDYSVLYDLEQAVPSQYKPRVWLAGDRFSAAERKYIISKCRLLVCARTHAAIAAYSSGVPALVLGYSDKSAGIAKDLNAGGFVINVSDIKDPKAVTDLFLRLDSNIGAQRRVITQNLPQYMARLKNYFSFI